MKKALFLLLILIPALLVGCGGEAKEPDRPNEETWISALPWEKDWTCLVLGEDELEPEAGKEALRKLLTAYSWVLTERDAQEAEPVPGQSFSLVPALRQAWIWTGEGSPLRFHVRRSGDVWWNGSLWRPVGEGAGERLLADFEALRDSGTAMASPPPIAYSCGEETLDAILDYVCSSWRHITRAGDRTGMGEYSGYSFKEIDWLDGSRPILRAEGDVVLSFHGREPDALTLKVFTPLGEAPVELRGCIFSPFAGENVYCLRAVWEETDLGGWGVGTYILLIEGNCASVLPETEGTEISVSLLEADAYGCSFTLENRNGQLLRLTPAMETGCWPLFRKTGSGSWEWIKPLRTPENEPWLCKAGETVTLGLDWSRELGTLEAGEYALLLTGSFQDRRGKPGGPVYLPLHFTLGEDALPQPPGPPALQELPEGFGMELERLSLRRYIQTLTLPEEGSFVPDRDFSLFRLEENGELTFLLPRYHLPAFLNYTTVCRGGRSVELEVSLAAQYGELKPGEYVVRRRILRLEEGDDWFTGQTPLARSWRTFPEDRILYLDTRLYVSRLGSLTIPAPRLEVEPWAIPYNGEEDHTLPVVVQNSRFSADGCRFAILNRGGEALSFSGDEYTLFFQQDGEWLPLARERHLGSGLIPFTAEPGESREWGTEFGKSLIYGTLSGGAYRLVFSVHLGEDREREYPLVVEFSIREDGTGQYTGLLREVRAVVLAYRSRLAEAYVLPEAAEDAPWFARYNCSRPTADPYVQQWEIKKHQGMIRVTVYRDRDVERAKTLLGDFPSVEVVRGEDFPRRSSPVREDKLGTLGILTAEPVVQTDPELYREGTWLLTLEVTAGETVWRSPAWVKNVFPEVWDREEERWVALPIPNMFYSAVGYNPVAMEPGMKLSVQVSLGMFHAEFSPEEEYRFVLESDAGPGTGPMQTEYYTCPFAVTGTGQA